MVRNETVDEPADPGRHQRQTPGEERVDDDARDKDNHRNAPVPKAGDVFRKWQGGAKPTSVNRTSVVPTTDQKYAGYGRCRQGHAK